MEPNFNVPPDVTRELGAFMVIACLLMVGLIACGAVFLAYVPGPVVEMQP